MFCKTCGANINNGEEECTNCGSKINGNTSTNFCGECGAKIENPKMKFCSMCGYSINAEFYDMNEFDLSTKAIKEKTKACVMNNEVNRKSLITIAYALPIAIVTGIETYGLIFSTSIESAIIYGVIAALISSIFIASIYKKCYEAISTRKAKFGWTFELRSYIPIAIVTVVIAMISNIGLIYKFINPDVELVCNLIAAILTIPVVMISYVAVSRDYGVGKTIGIGLKYGFKYFFRILWLVITFIPLVLLISITFGIVGIFKGFYIESSNCMLCEKILRKEKM